MDLGIDTVITIGSAVAAATAVIVVNRADIANMKEAALERAKSTADALAAAEAKRVEQATEIFRRLNALETSRPTHDDLDAIKVSIAAMDNRVRSTETGVATMSVKIESLEKSISRLSHLCGNTNSLVQLLVLNSNMSAKEKTEYINASVKEG